MNLLSLCAQWTVTLEKFPQCSDRWPRHIFWASRWNWKMLSLKTRKLITESLCWLIVSFEVPLNQKGICLYSSMSFPRIFGALVTRSTVTAVTPQKFICFACNTFHFSVSLQLNYLICLSTKGADQKDLSVSIFSRNTKQKLDTGLR